MGQVEKLILFKNQNRSFASCQTFGVRFVEPALASMLALVHGRPSVQRRFVRILSDRLAEWPSTHSRKRASRIAPSVLPAANSADNLTTELDQACHGP